MKAKLHLTSSDFVKVDYGIKLRKSCNRIDVTESVQSLKPQRSEKNPESGQFTIEISKMHMSVPDRPGLDIEVDEEALKNNPFPIIFLMIYFIYHDK